MPELSAEDALKAVRLFLLQYYERAGDDVLTLVADITIEADGRTSDPAAWDDWMRCVEAVRAERDR